MKYPRENEFPISVVSVELLDDQSIAKALMSLSWERENAQLVKTVVRHDFAAALIYVNEVGRICEEVGHHVDIELRWNTVTLRASTHSQGGITDADIDLAFLIDALD